MSINLKNGWNSEPYSGSTKELRETLLGNFFNCKFPNLRQLFPNIHKGDDHYTDVKGNFVFRYKMARLCRPPFCHQDFSNDTKTCQSRCRDIQTNQARDSCLENIPARNQNWKDLSKVAYNSQLFAAAPLRHIKIVSAVAIGSRREKWFILWLVQWNSFGGDKEPIVICDSRWRWLTSEGRPIKFAWAGDTANRESQIIQLYVRNGRRSCQSPKIIDLIHLFLISKKYSTTLFVQSWFLQSY